MANKKPQPARPVKAEEPEDVTPVEVVATEEQAPISRPSAVRAVSGDSYATLALEYGVNVSELVEMNGDAPIVAGTKVFLP